MTGTFWIETLGCPKNQVDSEKLAGHLAADGMSGALSPDDADLVVVNTCTFVDAARQESIDVILDLADRRRDGARVVVTGCMAAKYGDELAEAIPEVDAVVGFGDPLAGVATSADMPGSELAAAPEGDRPSPVTLGPTRRAADLSSFDLLNLRRPKSALPWAYVKVAEGCDRACGFCAIPSFRGPQRSRSIESILEEIDQLEVREAVLVAQDLAAFGRDAGVGNRSIVPLVRAVSERVDWVRLLYLYPSDLTDELIDTMLECAVPYFDLSLQHSSRPLLRAMRRWGDGERFLERIARIRTLDPNAAFRTNVIVGYPGETEDDHDDLLRFLDAAQLDWCGVFPYSREAGTYADSLDGHIAASLIDERVREASELVDSITQRRRLEQVGAVHTVLVDEPEVARSTREAPEIDGIIVVPENLPVGEFATVTITAAGPTDLEAVEAS